ncbi:MAG: glycosyltransferase family 2 protein [Burkholderiales bacterium]
MAGERASADMASADLSVVLINKLGFDRLSRIFDALARQSIADRLELVVVSPFDPPNETGWPFARVRYVKCARIDTLGPARAAGVQACSAPFVVFEEDHCFPRPGCAAALLGRLREGWTGVGPLILNHNPSTWTSRVDGLLNYGCFLPGCPTGEVGYIPPHHSAYPTAALRALGPELADLLQMDHHLQERLRAGGGRLFLEPSAQAAHTNVSRPLAHWGSQFHGSRLYGATRATHGRWPAYRRGLYAAAFPAIAVLRLVRVCRLLRDLRSVPLLPLLTIAATIAAAGEAWGYLFGIGSSLARRADQELDHVSYVSAADRPLLFR